MKYPKEIIVILENEGTENEFLATNRNISDVAIVGEKVIAARYGLIETIIVDTQVVTKVRKAKK